MRCVEIERLAGEQLGGAGGEDLVAQPLALAEVSPVAAPVAFEPRVVADAFDCGDRSKQAVSEPGDERMASGANQFGSVLSGSRGARSRLMGAIGKRAGSPAGLRCSNTPILLGKWLRLLRKILRRPAELRRPASNKMRKLATRRPGRLSSAAREDGGACFDLRDDLVDHVGVGDFVVGLAGDVHHARILAAAGEAEVRHGGLAGCRRRSR